MHSRKLLINKKAFTLLELLVTISIILLLLGTGLYTYPNIERNSRNQRREVDVESIRSALEQFKSDNPNHTYPDAVANVVPRYLQSIPNDPASQQAYNLSSSVYKLGICLTPSPPGLCSEYQFYVPLEPTGLSYLVANKYTTFLSSSPPIGPTAYPTPTSVPCFPQAVAPSQDSVILQTNSYTFRWNLCPSPADYYRIRIYWPSGGLMSGSVFYRETDMVYNTTFFIAGNYTWEISTCSAGSCSGSSLLQSRTYNFTYVPTPPTNQYTCYWNGTTCAVSQNCSVGNSPGSMCNGQSQTNCRSRTNTYYSCN